ncbi:hypothetical protein GYMLUDRAFT_246953 [Collybiopsis luxurians FD-317 M1]|uniref:Uncharacterized protein n=1 Tax=Collybiopsis luxurians FD-317 M1 TaxID=944289 RepID=A0A0D0CQC4_9AGAR|nr:hypothetical protein GYMLUDRAFT_246953 [Collybiopsis luxurians FD-317 M1]
MSTQSNDNNTLSNWYNFWSRIPQCVGAPNPNSNANSNRSDAPNETGARISYAAAVSRSSSQPRSAELPSSNVEAGVTTTVDNVNNVDSTTAEGYYSTGNIVDNDPAVSSTSEPEDENGHPWIKVQHRHKTKSLDNIRDLRYKGQFKPSKLTEEQVSMVQAAENNLTSAQREAIHKCNKMVNRKQRTENRPASPQPTPGPSSYVAKGKFVDNNHDISDKELNVEAQKEALANWNAIRDVENNHATDKCQEPVQQIEASEHEVSSKVSKSHKASGLKKCKAAKAEGAEAEAAESLSNDKQIVDKKHKKSTKMKITKHAKLPKSKVKGHSAEPSDNRLSMQPVDQLPGDSFLVKSLKNRSRKSKKQSTKGKKHAPVPSDSSDSSSSSSSDESGSGSLSSSEDESSSDSVSNSESDSEGVSSSESEDRSNLLKPDSSGSSSSKSLDSSDSEGWSHQRH